MKKVIYILALVFSITTVAQDAIAEGVVTSKMTMSSTNPDVQSQFDMIGEVLSTTYFKDGKTRTEVMNMMTGERTSIIDTSEKKMLIMTNNPMAGGKVYAESSVESSEEDMKGIAITKTDETKTVLGYECNKYEVVLNRNGAEATMYIYATNQVSAVNQQTVTFGDQFSGFPMYMTMTMSQQGMDIVMTMEVTGIKKESVSDDKFDMTPPEGYKKVDNIQGM